MSHPPAARLGDEIAHSNANMRMLAKVVGAVAGAAALGALCAGTIAAGVATGLAAAGTVATGGLAGFLLAGAVVLTGFLATAAVSVAGGALGEKIADWLVPEQWEVTGTITSGSTNVFINKKPAARATAAVPLDLVVCGKHSSLVPNLIAQGAAAVPQQTVVNDALAARKGDKVVCGATISSGSSNVFIGGPPETVREFDDEVSIWLRIALGVLAVRSLLKNISCAWKLLKDPKALIKSVECMLKLGQAAGEAYSGLSTLMGNPVHIATGAKVLGGADDLDFVLPGVMPIVWQRTYNSLDTRQGGAFGQGWSTPYAMELRLSSDAQGLPIVTYFDAEGRDIEFPAPALGEGHFSPAEGLGVMLSEGGAYLVVTDDGQYLSFGQASEASPQGVLRLQRIEDRNGNMQALRYDKQQRLAHLADSTGRLLEFTYLGDSPSLAQIELVIGTENETPEILARYRHDPAGQLIEVTDRGAHVARRFGYTQTYLTSHQLPTGLLCHYRWQRFEEPLGKRPGPHVRVVEHWTDDGEHYQFSYDLSQTPYQGHTHVTDAQGRIQRWTWNADHEITAYTNALGQTSLQTWSDTKQLLSHTDPLGATTTWAYDEAGNPTQETDPLGRSTRSQWSPAPASLLTSTTDADGASWKYHYDDSGNLTAEIDPLGSRTGYANDERGLPTVITDAHGGRKQLQWERRGLLVQYTDCSGKTTRYTYDPRGYPQQEVDAMGQTTTLAHDAQGRLLALQLPDGAVHRYQYDGAGQVVAATDPLGRSTSYNYSSRGQLTGRVKTVAGRASSIQLGYDAAHRLTVLVNENRQAYQFQYDGANRLVQETRIDGTRQALHMDGAGQVVGVTEYPVLGDVGSTVVVGHAPVQPIHTQLIRDKAGQLIQKNIYLLEPSAPVGTTQGQGQAQTLILGPQQTQLHYRYSPGGQLIQAQQLSPQGELLSEQQWQYDKLGQVVREDANNPVQGDAQSTAHSSTLHYSYDALGNPIATVLPGGRTLNSLYYGSGHLHQLNLDGAVIADFERDDVHQEVLRTQGRLASRFAYDGVGRKRAAWTRPAALKVGSAWQNSSEWQTRLQRPGFDDTLLKSYDYDKAGELTAQHHSRNGHTQHRYDEAGRIESTLHQNPTTEGGVGVGTGAGSSSGASPNGLSENFYFDPAGNRISALEHSSLSTQNRGWVEHNRVKVFEDKRFDYDGFGRLIRKRIGSHTEQHFQYNSQHQLVKVAVVRAGSSGQPHTQVFEYQYDVLGRRIAKRDAFGATRFTWEGMRLLQERRGKQLSTYLYEEGGYTPLARIDGEGAINPHPAAATAFGNVDTEQGKLQSIPVTNPAWGDRFHVLLKDGQSNNPTSTPPAANEGQWGQALPGQQAKAIGGSSTPQSQVLAAQAAKVTANAATPSTVRAELVEAPGESPKPPAQIYYFHTQTNGLPEELSDNGGNIVWRAQYKTWGSTSSETWQAFDDVGKPVGGPEAQPVYQPATNCLPAEQNLRMQGQYLDRETGLHYNTLRFYDPDLGAFTTPDPIGLNGGFNLYQYAPNPLSWIDPWGLAKCGSERKNRTPSSKNKNLDHSKTTKNADGSTTFYDKKGNAVTYDKNGVPDFSKYAEKSATSNKYNGNRDHDNRIANKQHGLKDVPEGKVWHHVDKNNMILMDKGVHDNFPHTGSASVLIHG